VRYRNSGVIGLLFVNSVRSCALDRRKDMLSAPDSHAKVPVQTDESGLVMTLRANAANCGQLDGCHMLLKPAGHDLLLQARKQRLPLLSQSPGRRDFLRRAR